MLDFLKIRQTRASKGPKKDSIIIYPDYIAKRSQDLMTRGNAFYAIWDKENNQWSTDMYRAIEIIDEELTIFGEHVRENTSDNVIVEKLESFSSKKYDEFRRYCMNLPDNFHILDSTIKFASDPSKRNDYSSKTLSYDMEEGDISAYDELVNTLYSLENRLKFEWAIGSVLENKGTDVQKFFVFYGSAGTGKSTILNIVSKIFETYATVFDSKSLASNKDFALEQFRTNPLVAIQHDGDLHKIEDNTKLNSLISHEKMMINEKYKSQYTIQPKALLFMGTNTPIQITDANSGMIRRLVDIMPTGVLVEPSHYVDLINQIDFEIPAIADHCRKVFLQLGPHYYDSYRSMFMIESTNEFYNFVEDNYAFFTSKPEITLSEAWKRYKLYCEEANIPYPLKKMQFKLELKSYFEDFKDHTMHASNVYVDFIKNKFNYISYSVGISWLNLNTNVSLLDKLYKDCKAQYSKKDGTPQKRWDLVDTVLDDLDSSREHYVQPPENHIVIDFDLKDEEGNKSLELNMRAASKFPKTYAEVSKGGQGLHLHYIYDGDINRLESIYDEDIEIKTFKGNSALRRRVSKCNNLTIATISSGLPLKEESKMINFEGFKNEKALRRHIEKCLAKEHHGHTKPEIDFIFSSLEKAYESGIPYDVSNMYQDLINFAMQSSNNSDYCLKLINQMKLKSKDAESYDKELLYFGEGPIAFYDVEVFPNLFLVNWKIEGKDNIVNRMINPEPEMIEELVNNYRLVGFNCRRYDNHIMYARMLGYSNEELYNVSQSIINKKSDAFFIQAYNLSYTDIYDYALKKQSLKKWEIDLHIHHQELGLPWDKPVPEEMWEKVAEYCDNDVIATEAVWNATHDDFVVREILVELSGLTVNHTGNKHAEKIIFGDDPNPQSQFVYTDLSTIFPGYKFDNGKSTYRGEEIGEGGYVYAKPGVYEGYIPVKDVESQHPHSIIALNLFGDKYTKRFADLLHARLYIKHGEYEKCADLFDGKLMKFLTDKKSAKNLSTALKRVINSVYGLTFSHYDTKFRDPRNIDNIVAKRGALFMCELKHQVEERGFTVLHCKTDSIKILNPDEDILKFVDDFGLKYGYKFEIENEFCKFALVNDAVYVAKRYPGSFDPEDEDEWETTGTEYSVPYVKKSLITHEDIDLYDMSETKHVNNGDMYLDMNENLDEDQHNYIFIGKTSAFVPMKEGTGGGILVRKVDENKYYAVTGTKGWRWMETEMVRNLDKADDINMEYYDKMVADAKADIEKFGADADKFFEL